MMFHYSKKGYLVRSFGTGDKVKLPGTAIDKPNVYDFSCTYDEIYNDLAKKDRALYAIRCLLLPTFCLAACEFLKLLIFLFTVIRKMAFYMCWIVIDELNRNRKNFSIVTNNLI